MAKLTVDMIMFWFSKLRLPPWILIFPAALVSFPSFALTEITDVRRDATVQAVEQVLPSVVNIATKNIVAVRSDPLTDALRRWWDPYYSQQPPDSVYSLGSGVVIDESGYLLTNDHVVRQADEIAVKFVAGTNVYTASIVAEDARRDVALLKINAAPGEKFHAIKLAREDDLLLGETVLALGNPFGLGGTVTRGILSSKSRSMPKGNAPLDIPNWLQTDAPINPGNSGGPLVNLRGELIGINVAVVNQVEGQPAQGIGFAIPIRLVEQALSDILPTEFVKSYWFGARVKVGSYPLVVTSVQPESPAGRAGIRSGDAVLQVNGKAPKNFIEFGDLLSTNARQDVTLIVRRNSELKEFAVRLVPTASVFNASMVREKLGLTLEPISAGMASRYRLQTPGFLVTGVTENSPAGDAGFQTGMMITGVDGQSVNDVTSLAKMIYSKTDGQPVQLTVKMPQRAGAFIFLGEATVQLVPR